MWFVFIIKSSRGLLRKTVECFIRRKEIRKVDVYRYKDFDFFSNDLSFFLLIIVFCFKSFIISSIIGIEYNNA